MPSYQIGERRGDEGAQVSFLTYEMVEVGKADLLPGVSLHDTMQAESPGHALDAWVRKWFVRQGLPDAKVFMGRGRGRYILKFY